MDNKKEKEIMKTEKTIAVLDVVLSIVFIAVAVPAALWVMHHFGIHPTFM